ncbi:squalene/phytoene synthase family protein [Actinoalloteichus sp. AHMU CJ021]|nr:squalene/phytoene synthase family protein [Actinoalloteichus sp. AHMU CJ021]
MAVRNDSTLRDSFALCRRVHAVGDRLSFLTVRALLPARTRPHAHAVYAFCTTSDRIADEGETPGSRRRHFHRWAEESLRELRRGHSDHPLRRAVVHTSRERDLDPTLFEAFLDATARDAAGPAEFPTFEDLRQFLRGVAGVPALLGVRLLGVVSEEADRLASKMGEVFQLVDITRDFPVDLPRGRVYVADEDLARFSVSRSEFRRGLPSPALDDLVRHLASRAREMCREGAALVHHLPPVDRPFMAAATRVMMTHFELVDRAGARALRQRVELSRSTQALVLGTHLLGARREKGRFGS